MTDEPKPNLDLLRRVLRQIDDDPKSWNQSYWATKSDCGTAYCFAGWACVLSDNQIDWSRRTVTWSDDVIVAMSVVDGDTIGTKAMHALRITQGEAQDLFRQFNTREHLDIECQAIARRAGEPLWPEAAP
jgi:hypothetical protein